MIPYLNESARHVVSSPLQSWCDCQVTYYNGMIIGAILCILLLATIYFVFHYWNLAKKEPAQDEEIGDEFYNGEET